MGEKDFFWGKPSVYLGFDRIKLDNELPKHVELPKEGVIPSKDKFKIEPKDFDVDFEIPKDIMSALFDGIDKQLEEYHKQLDEAIEKILRNYIDDPIKGKITPEKIAERGVTSPVFTKAPMGYLDAFVGLIQHDNIIFIDGSRMPYKDFSKLLRDYEKTNKPPLGVVPKFILAERRIEELKAAIKRFADANWPIPEVFVQEYNELVENLKKSER